MSLCEAVVDYCFLGVGDLEVGESVEYYEEGE